MTELRLLTARRIVAMNNYTGRASGRYYYPYSFKEKRASIDRKPYRKASIRLRGVGNKYQTSIRLEVWGKPKMGKTKFASGNLI